MFKLSSVSDCSNLLKYWHSLKMTYGSYFSISTPAYKVVPKNLKGKSTASQMWLSRQLSDPYVEMSRTQNYRCRSAFKLLEINEKYKILKPGQVVVDCGAAPGSWTQVAVKETNSDASSPDDPVGTVIAVDRSTISPIDGAVLLTKCDFTKVETFTKLIDLLQDKQVNVVISDMAPNCTGVKELDHESIIKLCYRVLRFAVMFSKPGGVCLMKYLDGYGTLALENELKRFYKIVKMVKPNASRSDSAEQYFLCLDFKGLKN